MTTPRFSVFQFSSNWYYNHYRISRNFSESKITRFILKIEYQILARHIDLAIFINYTIDYIISKQDVLL